MTSPGSASVPSRSAGTLSRVRAVILLAGSLRSTDFHQAIGRSVLDLPMRKDVTLLGLWSRAVADLAEELHWDGVPLRVVVDGQSPLPTATGPAGLEVRIERDPLEYRGTAGVLRDVCDAYAESDLVLVANATQLPRGSIAEPAQELAATRADVAVLAPKDGTPSSLMLLRCGVLESVSPVGFVDFKEQALPGIARSHSVRAVSREHPTTRPIRSAEDYLGCLRQLHLGRLGGDAEPAGPFEEIWRPVFAIVEEGAQVDPTAQVRDSVVLAGARVAAGARVVRSVLGPGATVGRRQLVLSEVRGTQGRGPGRKAAPKEGGADG